MKKLIVIAVLLNSFWILQAQNFNSNLASKLQAKLDELVTSFSNTKGMSAGVYVPGQGIWTGTSGLSYSGQPMTSDMKLGLASNSKLFTAVVMLILAEKNVISLEDHLYKWLPNFKNIDPNVTIRQLLNHTSGIDDMFGTQAQLDSINKNPLRHWTPEEVLTWIGPMKFIPGTNFYYSNTNYILAGMIAKNATGKHISKLIREYILTPMQLNNTYYDIEEAIPGTIAHRWYNNVDYHDTSRISLNTAGGPAGSLFSTPEDMLNWYNKLLTGQIINANSLSQMLNFIAPGYYGLGISKITLLNNTVWGHGGRTLGYKSRMIYDPCMKVVICGLTNSDPSAVDGITALLYKVLIDYLPACAGTISGIATVCQGQNGIAYTVPAIPNATSYNWKLPNGFIGSSSTNSILVNFDQAAVSGTIEVKGENAYGQGASSTFYVAVNPSPLALITANGSTSICSGKTLSLTSNDANSYLWSTGETTKMITVSKGGMYSLTVTNANGCKSLPASIEIKSISVPSQPDPINGPSIDVCPGTIQNYSVPIISGVQYYWIISQGLSIVQGQGSPNIQISFAANFAGGKLGVIMYNACGYSPVRYLDIFSIPEMPGYISGPINSNCQTTSMFRINKVPNAKGYTWTSDIPGVVISPVLNSSDTAVNIQFPNFYNGNIQVTANNNCGSSVARKLKVYGVPGVADKIFGTLVPCVGSIQYYYIAPIAGAAKYNWTIPQSTIILSGASTNIIKVLIGNNAGDISVTAENACGVGSIKKISITTPCQIQAANNTREIELSAYPNPTNGQFNIQLNQTENGTGIIQISNMQGKIIWNKEVNYFKGYNEFEVNASEFQIGLHNLVFISGNSIKSMRIVKIE